MKRFFSLLFALVGLTVSAQTTGVFKSTATATKNNLTDDLNIPSGKTVTVKSGGVLSAYSGGLGVRSSGAAFDLRFGSSEVLTANRTLSWVVGDAARTITLSGSPTLNNWFDQDVRTSASPSFTTVTAALAGNATTATALATGRTIGITGDLVWTSPAFTGAGNVTAVGTLATVNANVGTFGSATQSNTVTVNGKGLVTAISAQTVTPAVTSVTGMGAGVNAWLVTPTSANLAAALTDETGTGAAVFAGSPIFTGTVTASNITSAAVTDLIFTGNGGAVLTLVNGAGGFVGTTSGFRATGAPTFTGGAGVEISVGNIRSYNRTNSTYSALIFDASTIGFQISGSTKFALDSGGNFNATGNGTNTVSGNLTVSASILGSGNTAPTNTTSGSNQFTVGIATSGPGYFGGVINRTQAGGATMQLDADANDGFVGTTGASSRTLIQVASSTTAIYGVFSKTAWGLTGARYATVARTFTDTSSSGTVASAVSNSWGTATFAASSATTYTNAATVYINAAPTAGANVTITNGWGLWNAANTRLDGSVLVNNTSTLRNSQSGLTTVGNARMLKLSETAGALNTLTEIGFGYDASGVNTYQPVVIGQKVTTSSGNTIGSFYVATRNATTDTAPTIQFSVAGNGDSTFTGNAIISGTGTSSFAGLLTTAGGFSSSGNTSPSSGTSVEVRYDGSSGQIIAYNRTGANYVPNALRGSTLTFGIGGSNTIVVDASQNTTFAATTSGTSTTNAAVVGKSSGWSENVYVGGLLNITSGTTDGASISTYGLQIRTDTATKAGHISASQSGVENYPLYLGADGYTTNLLFIDASGYVGVGTLSPTTYAAFAVRRGVTGVSGMPAGYSVAASFSDNSAATFAIAFHATNKVSLFSDNTLNLGASNAIGLTLAATTQNATFVGTVATADPTNGSGAWKLGKVRTSVAATMSTTTVIEIMVDGTRYDIPTTTALF